MTTSITCIFSLLLLLANTSQSDSFTLPFRRHDVMPSSTSLEADFLSYLFGGGNQNAVKSKIVFDIPTTSVKVGAIRFFLNLHLVGLQRTSDKGTWFSKEDAVGGLDLYFKDGSGMVSLSFSENAITAERSGEKPSLQYLLQESILLHGVLDELNKLAFEVDDIEEDKRLLQLKDLDGIVQARTKLPARAA